MVDTYHYGKIERLAPEYPIPVHQYLQTTRIMGGMGNVAFNVNTWRPPPPLSMFQDYEVHLFGRYCPDDDAGKWLETQQQEHPTIHFHLFSMSTQTTEKIRFVTLSNEILFRHDRENTRNLQDDQVDTILNYCRQLEKQPDVIVFSDYDKGFLSPYLITSLRQEFPESFYLVDGKRDFDKVKKCHFIKGNLVEFSKCLGCSIDPCDINKFLSFHSQFQARIECQYSLMTLGKYGLSFFSKNDEKHDHSNILKPDCVSDVTGSGDIILACMIWGMVQKITPQKNSRVDWSSFLEFSEHCAVWNVNSFGTTVIPCLTFYQMLFQKFKHVYSIDTLGWNYLENIRPFSTIVFTNGCFDLLHAGHLSLLRYAKSLASFLIVGLNTDDSVQQNKGKNRPILPYETRKQNLLSLGWIDWICPLEDKTPFTLLRKIRPHILVKGGDYSPENVIGKEYADQLVLFDFQEGMSSTKIIQRVLLNTNDTKCVL